MTRAIIGGNVELSPGNPLPLSKGNKAGDFVFLSGQLGVSPNGQLAEGIGEQTIQTLENIKEILALAGLDLSSVVKSTVWLTDMANFKGFNQAYAEAFPLAPPVRSTVCSGLVLPGALIEIEVIAYAG